MRYGPVVFALLLQAATAWAALPSIETINAGVMRKALRDLPREFDECDDIIFVQRGEYADPHWYANIAYFCDNENQPAYTSGAHSTLSSLRDERRR